MIPQSLAGEKETYNVPSILQSKPVKLLIIYIFQMVKLRLREVNYPAQAWNSDSNLGLFGYKAYARNRRYPFPPPLPHPLGLFNESSPWRTEVGGGGGLWHWVLSAQYIDLRDNM